MTLVLLLSGSTMAGLPDIVLAARQHGVRTTAVAGADATARVRAFLSTLDGVALVPDPYDPAIVAAGAREVAGGVPAAVLARDDAVSAVAARAGELLGAGRPGARGIMRARNKLAARLRLSEAGLTTPPFTAMSAAEDAPRVADEVGLPAIVKPVNGTASHGIRRVETVAELAAAYRELTAKLPGLFGGMYDHALVELPGLPPVEPGRTLLVEALMSGDEYSFDLLVRDGAVGRLMILDKFLMAERYLECGFAYPPLDRSPDWQERAWRTVEAAVGALGLDNTVAHVEIMDDPRLGPTIIEVNPARYGGGVLPRMIGGAVGVDLNAELVALALGRPPTPRHQPTVGTPVANLCFYPREPGILVGVRGIEEIVKLPGVAAADAPDLPCRLSGDEESGQFNVITQGVGTRAGLLAVYREVEARLEWDIRWAGWRGVKRRPVSVEHP